jgi:hypothetical protein
MNQVERILKSTACYKVKMVVMWLSMELGTLQIGIKENVSTLGLHGPRTISYRAKKHKFEYDYKLSNQVSWVKLNQTIPISRGNLWRK